MLRYKTENRPGLVALYDIRPGNGAGQFLQPRIPHGATNPITLRARRDNQDCYLSNLWWSRPGETRWSQKMLEKMEVQETQLV